MRNIFKSLFVFTVCLMANAVWAEDATFTMSSIFTGNNQTATVTSPVAATVTTTASKSNASQGKLGSDGNYFEIVLANDTYTAVTINGYINTTNTDKNWAFQFSTDGGTTWSSEVTQPNDGNKTAHDIQVSVAIPANANGFRVIRRAGTSTMVNSITLTLAGGTPAGPVAVTGVTVSPTTLNMEAGQTATLTATVLPSNADNQQVTWSCDNTNASVDENGVVTANAAGTAVITVTTVDGSFTATCTVTITEPTAPVSVLGVSLNKTSTSLYVGGSETLTATVLPADATNKAVTWSSGNTAIATVSNGVVTGVAVGTTDITVTTVDGGYSATCAVTVEAAPVISVTGVSLNKSSLSLQIGENETLVATVTPNNAANKNVSWSSSNASIASVDQTGKVSGVAAGTATITVTTEDGNKTATCTVTVTSGPPVPTTGLTTHLPEVYEAKEVAGGYNTPLTIVDGREYEVYYINRDGESKLSVSVSNADKAGSISNSTGSNSMEAKDGWFTVSSAGSGGDTGGAAKDEFKQSIRKVNMKDGCEIQLHVKGFDQFSFYGKDNSNSVSKCFEVYINNVKQTTTPDNTYSIRRFDLNGESLISVKALSSSNSVFLAFSLRLAQEPRTKWIDGNDSTQVVLQTASPKPVKYFTKYNNMGETRLEWDGPTATGIKLDTLRQTALGDTLVLGGIANCPTGIYNYRVASFYNGIETSSVSGKIRVASEIKALTDTFIDAYQNEAMDEIRFRYYALNASDVQIDWTNGTPAGVNTSGNNGTYIISGTPTIVGVYPFTITVTGGNSIQGKIEVKELDLGNNPVLYLYKNNLAYNRDGIFKYLTSPGGGSRNLISRKAKEEGLRPADQYAKYKWVLISEDVDADNKEILALARGEGNLPVLSMKSFSYTPGRLNWGEPNNGSLTMEEGRFITVQRADHPIFKALNKKQGDRIQVLDTVVGKGLMPVSVDYLGTLCLATARTRDINDYYADGPEETFMHEVPAEMHRNQKYICLPIGLEGSNYLSASGKKLIDECIKYILGNEATIQLPDLAITEFKIGNHKGVINDNENLITITILAKDSDEMKAATPEITLASPMTFATPDKMNEDGTVDFSNWHFGVRYVVSDYINKRAYDVIVQIQAPEAIDEIEAGEWVNIFDIYGRKMTTTNQNLRTLDLPHGMYIVVTESGKSIKIMR